MALAASISSSHAIRPAWLIGQRWDLSFIIFTAALVPIPILANSVAGVPSGVIDVAVAGIIGGPHVLSTLQVSFMERRFIRSYRLYAAGALAIPVIVFYAAATNLTLLLLAFMLWASVHVMHQIAFITDCYRVRGGEGLVNASRAIDYSVLFLCMYPVAFYRLVNDDFVMGSDKALHAYFPAFLKGDWLVALVSFAFATALILCVGKTVAEYRAGTLNVPKTLLIGVTVAFGAVIARFDNLDVAFQGMNVWHSAQYLAIIWYLNQVRQSRGEITNPLVKWLAACGRGSYFYLFNVGLTILAGGTVFLLRDVVRMPQEQAYYSVILSCLLIHYYIDHVLFFRGRAGAGQAAIWPAGAPRGV